MTIAGVDYSFSPHPSPAALRAYGAAFAVRYASSDAADNANGKNLLPAELAALRAESLSVVLVFETAADRMLAGLAAGEADAASADASAKALGMTGIPVYFACDFDATPAQQAAIDAYLDGAASVIGLSRTGIYGGYYPVSRAFSVGKAAWGYQTLAWSGGQWCPRAQIRQTAVSVVIDGAQCDHDVAETANYGQWPLYAPAKPPEAAVAEFSLQVPALAQGESSAAVKAVQRLATPVGAGALAIDGDYGPLTAAAVRDVQSKAGLPQADAVDEATWKALLAG